MAVRRLGVLIGLALSAAVGCDGGAGDPPGPTPTRGAAGPSATAPGMPSPGSDATPAGWARCVNEVQGYTIAYPADWFTTTNNPENACRWFDPEPFEVRDATEGPLTAMTVTVVDQPFAELVRSFEQPEGRRVLRAERSEVAGRPALRHESENTEEILLPVGARSYGWLVDFGDRAVLVETTALPGETYGEAAAVVDRAVRTLTPAAGTGGS